ncbi:hypothetical protein HanIR_Chr08g0351401 [Helianthus annuus]|nr:hypothetical protein HanIR_Chr08g0351401 [Helianthus annuus]
MTKISIPFDMPFCLAGWEVIHRSITQGVPETIRNPRVYSTGLNNFQNPQINPSSNSSNINLQQFPLLPEWHMGWGQQYMNQANMYYLLVKNQVSDL